MWTYHTVHMHGADFFLTNIGFPETYANGTIKDINSNLNCLNEQCTKQQWNEEALNREEVRGHFIAKNTLLLPAQGYTIVRFRATNPGYWPLHCHNMMHNLEGMMLLFHVHDEKENRPFSKIPEGLPQCASLEPTEGVFPWQIRKNAEAPLSSICSTVLLFTTFLLNC